MSQEKYWLAFGLVKGIGSARVQLLLQRFGDLKTAWQAPPAAYHGLGFDHKLLANMRRARSEMDLDALTEQLRRAGVGLLTWESADYPTRLRQIPLPPPVLFLQGDLLADDEWSIAVVGTRRMTSYGRQVTRDIVEGLVNQGITVVSGLARGVDAWAHQSALELGGRTLAVLGSGLDHIYPPENRALSEKIRRRGALISEYGLGVKPEARNFPPRNRIVSGLSRGVVIVEAGERSGALITARFALEQDREVFAVPGNVNSPASHGPNRLIQSGAKLVLGIEDILGELQLVRQVEHSGRQMALPESTEEAVLLTHLTGQPLHVDELSRLSQLSSSQVNSTLVMMELKGMVRQVGGLQYIVAI